MIDYCCCDRWGEGTVCDCDEQRVSCCCAEQIGNAPDGVIRFSINGEERKTTDTPLSVRRMLAIGGEDAAINQSQLSDYHINHMETGKQWIEMNDKVHISNGDRFIALYVGRTPFA